MLTRRSLGWPITLGVVMIVLLVALTVGWVLVVVVAANRASASGYWWAILAVGTTFLALVLVGVVLYLLISIKEIRLNQRQSNFIDSVTHELKSPLASLKLYVQTLSRRNVTEAQQADFHRFMLDDLQRLDSLINHMLDTARLNQAPPADETIDVELADVLRGCAKTACMHYRLPDETITLDVQPALVRGQPIDVEIVFRNLIDNALKYSGDTPEVLVQSWVAGGGTVVTRIIDNGPGIPINMRRKIFGRFFRIGSELERSKTGTGLGLFIVRTLVKRMRGKVNVRGRGTLRGSVFEVELPGHEAVPQQSAA
ncbi:MAG TPA: HAMP domain-containing sensor histidine kinase [Pirellulales bacterium]|jgi:two-component system, OmpR family, phosphate regulon sensor histidine kinase PhoR